MRDSLYLISQLSNLQIPQNTLLVTLDVESLSTIIRHEVGVRASMYFLEKQPDSNQQHDSLLIDLLEFVLKHNYFVFDRSYYKHVSGTAVGA